MKTPEENTDGSQPSSCTDLLGRGWKCDLGDGKYDHDWEFVPDWYGDPEVIGGTADCSFWRCRACREETTERPNSGVGIKTDA